MAFRKFKADRLFDGYRFHNANSVLVTDEEGIIEAIVPSEEAGDDVLQLEGILSPGFINCHCHLELSHMKSVVPEKTGLVRFVTDIVQQRHFPEEEILQAIGKAEDEMLTNGIVAVGDICNNALTIPQKAKGRIHYHNFIEASGFNPQIAKQRFERSVEFFRQYARNYSIPVESNSIVPHAPYSVTDELWELIINFPGNHLLTIHNQETAGEDEWSGSKTGELTELYEKMNIDTTFYKPSGKSSLQTYLPKFLKNQTLILVHNVHTTEEDLLFCQLPIVHCQLYWCLCPNANLYITGQLPDIELLMKHDTDIVLGTDSLASNHQLSILEEIRTIQKYFPHIELETILKWATSNGAKALKMDSLLGSFDPPTLSRRKKPGVVLVDNDLAAVKRLI
ncbi:MAG TPA: amidohydrolase family protein [Chitinophagaceae bacterium]|nr:amidohydrolase family protein [Chitinophagaceae bacterium]